MNCWNRRFQGSDDVEMGSKAERETSIWINTHLLVSENNVQQQKQQPWANRRNNTYNWIRGRIISTSNRNHTHNLVVRITDTCNDRLHYNKTISLPSHVINDHNNILVANVYGEDENDSNLPPNNLMYLTHLHEPALVECLQLRYNVDQIYTYTGPILLALNPFKPVQDLYSNEVMQYYYELGCSSSISAIKNSRQPHVFATADDAFRNMIRIIQDNNNQQLKQNRSQGDNCHVLSSPDQSILVSGESGAGKTVTTKYIMAYLASLSERDTASLTVKHTSSKANQKTTRGTSAKQQQQSIEQQVLQSNPILESFGNARTIRNDNSSRFGKFISLHFHQSTLLGATIRTYLLEKVRLVHQMPGERTFHVFYELLSGNDKRKFHLVSPSASSAKDFKMTSASNTFTRRDAVSDKETFHELKVAMDVVGFTVKEQSDIFAVVSAILHSSNFTFEERQQSHPQHQIRGPTTTNIVPCSSFVSAAALLGVDTERLKDALCTCTIVVAGKSITKTLSCEQAIKANESMMKALYGALFSFLVNRINQSICGTTANNSDITEQNDVAFWNHHDATKAAKINVLDIFGFESFDVNSLEQLCINYCNEALQQQFNRFVFKLEQHEYEREGIEWSFIEFPDNQDVVCIENPVCPFSPIYRLSIYLHVIFPHAAILMCHR